MNVEIAVIGREPLLFGTIKLNGRVQAMRPFSSFKDAEKWATDTSKDITKIAESLHASVTNTEIKRENGELSATVTKDGITEERKLKNEADVEAFVREVVKCDCPKCRAKREAEAAKSEPEVKPEEAKPNWTPEVGMLIYMRPSFGFEGVYEVTKIAKGKNRNVSFVYYRSLSEEPDTYPDHWELAYIHEPFRPIAEFEGLEVGDKVFSINQDGVISEWTITILGSSGKIVAAFEAEEIDIALHVSGGIFEVGNGKQMFWRTRDRAERFGK